MSLKMMFKSGTEYIIYINKGNEKMKIDLGLIGTDEKEEKIDLHLIANSVGEEFVKVKISYQEIKVSLEELENAVKYIKGNN